MFTYLACYWCFRQRVFRIGIWKTGWHFFLSDVLLNWKSVCTRACMKGSAFVQVLKVIGISSIQVRLTFARWRLHDIVPLRRFKLSMLFSIFICVVHYSQRPQSAGECSLVDDVIGSRAGCLGRSQGQQTPGRFLSRPVHGRN